MSLTSPNSNSCSTGSCCPLTKWMLPILLGILLVSMLTSPRPRTANVTEEPPAEVEGWLPSEVPTGKTVQLEIDFGNGSRREFSALPWRDGMTVEEVLEKARKTRPGIEFTQKGEGSGGFLTSLEGVNSEGSDGRNWQYEVGDQPGTQSFSLQTVGEGEVVRWRFAPKEAEQ